MTTPSFNDLKTYIGTKLTNVEWDFNFQKIVQYLTSKAYDVSFNKFSVAADSDMGGAKLTNLGTPTSSTDAANKSYVDTVGTPAGYINGLILSNNSTNPNTDIDISPGICQSSTNTKAIQISSSITKKLNSSWASGTGAGMLDTGSIATSTWYHIFAITKDDSTSDILASTSSTNPLLPSGFTKFRRIGSIRTDASGNILGFSQTGDYFKWAYPTSDLYTTSAQPASTLLTVSTIPNALTDIAVYFESANATNCYVTDYSDTVASSRPSGLWDAYVDGNTMAAFYIKRVKSSSTSQIRYSCTVGASFGFRIKVLGYVDSRGKN